MLARPAMRTVVEARAPRRRCSSPSSGPVVARVQRAQIAAELDQQARTSSRPQRRARGRQREQRIGRAAPQQLARRVAGSRSDGSVHSAHQLAYLARRAQLGLVLGDQRVAVSDFDQAGLRQQLGEAACRARSASAGPRWPRRSSAGRSKPLQRAGGREQVAPALRGAAHVLAQVAADLALRARPARTSGPSPRVGPAACSSARRSSAACAADRSETAARRERSRRASARCTGSSPRGAFRRARCQTPRTSTATSRAMRASWGPPISSCGAAPVAHRERDLVAGPALDELAEERRDAAHRQVRVGAHRLAVARRAAASAARSGSRARSSATTLRHSEPSIIRPCTKTITGPLAAGVLVVDRSRRQLHAQASRTSASLAIR